MDVKNRLERTYSEDCMGPEVFWKSWVGTLELQTGKRGGLDKTGKGFSAERDWSQKIFRTLGGTPGDGEGGTSAKTLNQQLFEEESP